jgi:hypothetical protein
MAIRRRRYSFVVQPEADASGRHQLWVIVHRRWHHHSPRQIIAETGRRSENLRRNNGPELIANVMRDWCPSATSGPRSPNPLAVTNGYSESFNGRFRDELFATEQIDTLLGA